MQENPVWNREVRGRWRRPLTTIAFFGYAAALAVVAGAYYESNIVNGQVALEQSGRVGQNLFLVLARVQLVLVSLFATALTAPAIVAERESGTLVLLRLSPLTLPRMIYGKFNSTVLLTLLLILVPLPMSSLAFVMGGVSAPDFCAVTAIQIASAVFFAALGLVCSAAARTASQALGIAFGLTTLSVMLPVSLLELLNSSRFIGFSLLCCALGLMVSWIMIWIATVRVEADRYDENRVFEPAPMLPAQPVAIQTVTSKTEPASLPSSVAKLPSRQHNRLTPIGRLLRFENPVLERQLRINLRFLCEAPPKMWKWHATLMLALWLIWTGGWAYQCLHLYYESRLLQWANYAGEPYRDIGAIRMWMTISAVIIVMAATLGAASAFTRERTQNMLSGLLMTPLSPRDVAGGKRDAALIAASFYLLLALPSFALGLAVDAPTAWLTLLATLLFAALGSSIGLLCAWFCPSPGIAVAGSIISFLGVFFAIVLEISNILTALRDGGSRLSSMPWAAGLSSLLQPAGAQQVAISAAVAAVLMLGVSACLIMPVLRGLRPAALDRDGESWLSRDLSKAI